MDKTDLTYDVVRRIEDMLVKRLDEQECRLCILEKFKTKVITISGFITLVISISYSILKDWLHV